MENNKKIELTLCGMLPYKLQLHTKQNFIPNSKEKPLMKGAKATLTADLYADIENETFGLNPFTPILHSLDKLTEPILESGLIPIVELAKIASLWDTTGFTFEVGTDELGYWCNVVKGGSVQDCMFFDGGIFVNNYEMSGEFSYRDIPNQLELFEKLKKWHFNIYDLPKEMYIEKSEL